MSGKTLKQMYREEIDQVAAINAGLLEALEATVNPLKDCYGWDRPNALIEQVESAIRKAKEGK
jgi:hypothetical protein